MDQVLYHQELQSLNLFMKYKKALQFILSLSIFSILISHHSWFSSLFLHSMNLYFNNFPFHLVDCALDRKFLFLICNGILVFLSTNSGLIGSPSSKTHQNYVEHVVQEDQKYEEEIKNEISTKNEEVKEEEKKENWVMIANEEFEEEEKEVMVKFDEGEEENGIFMDEQGGHGMLSTEELNKKFDEFIRKMKEEIRVGAQQQQQLVMV